MPADTPGVGIGQMPQRTRYTHLCRVGQACDPQQRRPAAAACRARILGGGIGSGVGVGGAGDYWGPSRALGGEFLSHPPVLSRR